MLEAVVSPSVLVNGDNHVLHLSERAGRYLLPPGGPLQQAWEAQLPRHRVGSRICGRNTRPRWRNCGPQMRS